MESDPNIVGTMIQLTGTLLVGVLCSILLQTVRTPFLYYWGYGWGAMSAALLCLLLTIVPQINELVLPIIKPVLLPAYCFAEYAAGFFWIAGCRSLAVGTRLVLRDLIWVFPAGVAAVIVPRVVDNPNGAGLLAFHALHSLMKTGIYATAFAVLYRNREKARGAGSGVMMATFFMLTVDYLQYAVLCTYSYTSLRPDAFPHLKYASFYELMLEMLLAFGMVMVVMEYVRHELESANLELRKAGSRLKKMAECDPLTGALNRHAFEEFTSAPPGNQPPPPLTGTVALLDVDNLKPINDTLGHAAGDQTIQLVAQTIRSVIRPDDLLFRWGGDEFLILWIGALKESDAEMRLDRLNEEVARNARSSGIRYPIEPSVSFGVAGFANRGDLDAAIHTADARMYARKQAKKKAG